MLFENLRVRRVVVHEVFQRADDRTIRPPAFADSLEALGADAMDAFRQRMTDALSGQTQSIRMRIAKSGQDSFLTLAETLVDADDATFLSASRTVAEKMAEAQMGRGIPGGMLIVFDGTVGAASIPFVGVIKAETQAGFRRSLHGPHAVVEFLQNIFLTPATRLYKIGVLIFDDRSQPQPNGRRAFVFDSNISLSNREAAAAYFYEGFLGCALPSDGPYETAKFFDLTKEFVRKSSMNPERKRDVIDSLYSFIKVEQDPTFTADQFGERFLPPDLRDPFSDFLQSRKFTSSAVVRDISQMGNRLRRRKFKFGADIELSASPEALENKITIEAIDGDLVEGARQIWTRITLREALTEEQ